MTPKKPAVVKEATDATSKTDLKENSGAQKVIDDADAAKVKSDAAAAKVKADAEKAKTP